jgi:hypothetical protein
MFYSILSRWSPYTAFAAAIIAGPLAYAAPLTNDADGLNAISSLQLGATQLKTNELGAIRGGFDLSPKLSINFAFQQIDYQGTNIIQSIMVPMTTLTQTAHNAATTIISSNGAPTFMQPSQSGSPSGNDTESSVQSSVSSRASSNIFVQPNSSENASNGNSTISAPTNASSIAVTSTANNGQSVVISQLGSGGITNIIMNQANNTLLSQVTNMNIDISGMSQWLSQQRGSLVSSGGAFGNSSFFR